jgi:predicted acyltransferase
MGGAQSSATIIAAVVVTGAWGWIGWQSIRTKAKPARATLYMMAFATVILMLGFLWPRIEALIVSRLRSYTQSFVIRVGGIGNKRDLARGLG